MADARGQAKRGDALVESGTVAEAVACYEDAAQSYSRLSHFGGLLAR
jgi:predicted negative regulator of RcsB-dependent stress response